ncbi:hypothetical protein BH10ACT1_BH10ACT1_19530 [soil metagenome]
MTEVIVLNGASSSGKTSIARALQQQLAPEPWTVFGIDTLVDALPTWLGGDGGGLDLADDGSIAVGPVFRQLEAAWYQGLAAMARSGARLVVDDVFLSGARSQRRVRAAFAGIDVVWVGVRCSTAEGERRERDRGDRVPGQHAHQVAIVHQGVGYDLEVDTTSVSTESCAQVVVAHIRGRAGEPGPPG